MKLELMDWQRVEEESREQLRTALANVAIAEILLSAAEKQVKSFGGTTLSEKDKKAKSLGK